MGGKEAMIFLFYLFLRTINLSEVSLIIAAPFTTLLLRVYQQSHYKALFSGVYNLVRRILFLAKTLLGQCLHLRQFILNVKHKGKMLPLLNRVRERLGTFWVQS